MSERHSERQRRADAGTAKAVARGVNIEAVRNRSVAEAITPPAACEGEPS